MYGAAATVTYVVVSHLARRALSRWQRSGDDAPDQASGSDSAP
jgi:hypothetical protein